MDNIGQSLEQMRDIRIEKVNKLKALGFNPYPAKSRRTSLIKELIDNFEKYENKEFILTGRLMAFREHGKLAFGDLRDSSGKIQLYIKGETLTKTSTQIDNLTLSFDDLISLIDVGDFVEARGVLTKTKRGEVSLEVKQIIILTKTIRPLPDSWDGLKDTELRQRKRYLDMVMDTSVRERFERRSKFWDANREFMKKNGFYEVNIPVLELTTGGADAKPFTTHMDAIDQDFYLRISHELPLKRLIGGGFEKVFDIGPRFRNEGFSDEHLPEHIAMEFYWAYADYNMGMDFIKEMFTYILQETYGKLKFNIKDFDVDLTKDWEKIDYTETIKKRFNVDIFNTNIEQVYSILEKEGVKLSGEKNLNRGIDNLWKLIRKTIAGPAFMYREPKFLSPLAKSDINNPLLTERFHPIIAGSELGNGFSELNDPIDQYERFMEQEKLRASGDEEAQMMDKDFVEMLEYGMPPTFGWGHSERVFWFFENVSAREGVPFPPMRREGEENKEEEKK